jgi:general secretion pathway protein L
LSEALLLFHAAAGFAGWVRLAGGEVAERGPGLDGAPAARPGLRVVGVVPGELVALHWLDLPAGLSPAQAAAAARLAAAELSAEPVAGLHVALGAEAPEGARCVALVPSESMAGWIAAQQEGGYEADLMLPDTLLIPEPETGLVRYERGGIALHRGPAEAFALEPGAAALVAGDRPVRVLDRAAFEAGLAEAVERPLLDLRQGDFARRRRLRLEGARLRRLAWLALGVFLVGLVVQIAAILRYTYAADALEAEADRIARAALPRGSGGAGPGALGRRLTELRGGGAGYGTTASALFGAIRATPNAELSAISFAPDGSLRATVRADAPPTLAALRGRLGAAGFAVEAAPPRSGGGRQVQELTARPR